MKILEIRRFLNESSKKVEEDEMTSAILSTAPQGGALECSDNYAPGDMRVPKSFSKIQKRRKVDEDAEEGIQYLYRYMSIDELSSILSENAFTNLLDFKEDSNGLQENPAGDYPYFKSFTYKLTKDGLNYFMGDGHIICLFSKENMERMTKMNDTKLMKYKFDKGEGATHEYEYRLFAKQNKVRIDPAQLIRKIVLTKQSGNVELDDIENILLDLSYAGINAPVEFIPNVLSGKSKKISYKLDENDEIVVLKS